jgi:hypothetical protein
VAVNQNTVQEGSSAHTLAWALSNDAAKSRSDLFILVIFIYVHFQNDFLYILPDLYKKTDQQSHLTILLYMDVKQEKCVGLFTLSNRTVVQIH